MTQTAPLVNDAMGASSERLTLVLLARAPGFGGASFEIRGLDELRVVRGERLTFVRRGGTASLEVPDPTLSASHARLARRGDGLGWLVLDLGSKNGVFVNGTRVEREELRDGSVLRLGSAFFLIRSGPATLPDECRADAASGPLVTLSPRLAAQLQSLRAAARSSVNVVLNGEPGTGKHRVARAFHEVASPDGPFVAVGCSGRSPRLEAELFGPGGHVQAAHGGTLVLSEIAELPLSAQAALLRVLQERRFVPLGARTEVPTRFRLLVTTRRPLGDAVRAGKLSSDLFTRIAGFSVALLPLRERLEDLGAIIAALLGKLPEPTAGSWALAPATANDIVSHAWPENIRQLERVLETAALLAPDGNVQPEHLRRSLLFELRGAGAPAVELGAEERALRGALIRQLRATGGNVSAVARAMGKARMQVQRWLRRFALDPRDPGTWTDLPE